MSQFKYLNEMNALLNIDGPLTNVPVPRWQKKKGQENSSVLSNGPLNSSKSVLSSSINTTLSSNKTPNKDVVKSRKTPSKTPGKGKSPSRSKTPTPNKGAKTPGGGDRFIPTRSAINFDLGHFKINQDDKSSSDSPQNDLQKAMCENLHGADINKQRILSYQVKAPSAPEGFQNPMRIVYTQTKTPASAKTNNRYIPQAPDRILDAPDIKDDYYLNLIDWNASNILAVALESQIYLWDAGTGKIEQLLQLEGNDYVCSVSWIQEGSHLAVGTTKGTVELWDCSQMRRMRTMDGHSARVGSLSWNSYILTSGCRTGQIIHHDVRQRDHNVLTVSGHSQEVCGLKWSTDGKYLASGGNDNVLNVWQVVGGGQQHSQPTPLYTFTSHQAAVKALAWCPWQPNVLASGGGTADRHIRFWNCSTGSCVNAVDTKSQVCALLWSTTFKELVSGHGFANNQIIIWKYPGMKKITELTGHSARVLHLAMSPDGTTVLSAGADETLRLWKCFVKTTSKKETSTGGAVKAKTSVLKLSIR